MNYQHQTYHIDYILGGAKKGEKKWDTFQHNGVLFPPLYQATGVEVIYQGKPVSLTPDAEEAAFFYARYIKSDYKDNKTFNRNFWKDWRKILGKEHLIKSLEECDFSLMYNMLERDREIRKNLTKEEKEEIKKKKQELHEGFKYCLVDGKKEEIGNFLVEPPGIFLGRGSHPQLGRIKRRVHPEDVTLNLDKDAPIPKPSVPGEWGKIIHDNTLLWLASWKDEITGKTKYVFLSQKSELSMQSDMEKFEKARRLGKKIAQIRKVNEENLQSENKKTKQLATTLYLIDRLALRIGNEKGKDQADTVGVTSLRIEHITLKEGYQVKLNFLGKDSIRYIRTFEVDPTVYKNLESFIEAKSRKEMLFDLVTPNDVNKYLQEFMKGLTSKVFRTYNSSRTFHKQLKKIKDYSELPEDERITILLHEYNKANKTVAELCNHQKSASKNFSSQIAKINEMIENYKKKIRSYQRKKAIAAEKGKKASKEAYRKRIEKTKKRIKELRLKKEIKTELKTLSLGTSRMNYIDPRITIAFFKKHNLPLEKVFSSNLQDKFKWAMEVESDFKF